MFSWVRGGGDTYTDRGDPAAWDFDVDDLTTDGTWRDLDLSSIVPAGATAVHLFVKIRDDNIDRVFLLKEKGNANDYNVTAMRTQVANLYIPYDCIVSCDGNRKLEYWASNITWTQILIIVRGWFI